jgi:hypothetical protein
MVVVFDLAYNGFGINALTGVVVCKSCLDSLLSKYTAVDFYCGKTVESFNNCLVCELESLADRLTLDKVCCD